MRLQRELSGDQLALLGWEASFLPDLGSAGDGSVLQAGDPEVARWPRSQRLAVAVQLLAAASFLLDRGFFPSRRLLRGARVTRHPGGVAVRLPELPDRRLDAPRLERRLRRVITPDSGVLSRCLLPLLRRLVPQRLSALERVSRERPAWELAGGWLEVLAAGSREAALAHPDGPGRALWACRMAPLGPGVWWSEEQSCATRAAEFLTCRKEPVAVSIGELEEEDVVRIQARAAAAGLDAVVITFLPLPQARVWGVDEGADAVWVLAPRWELAHAHMEAVLHSSGRRLGMTRSVLTAGAARAFGVAPVPLVELPGRTALASPPARRVLAWIGGCPAGLDESELECLLGRCGEHLVELERLGLVVRRGGRWHAATGVAEPDPERLQRLAEALPETSGAGVLARALVRGEVEPANAWCEARLAERRDAEVLEVAAAGARLPDLALAAAEAALRSGRLGRAEHLGEGVAPPFRGNRWQLLRAWWADAVGLPQEAVKALDQVDDERLPPRLAGRALLLRGSLARRRGDRPAAFRLFEKAVTLSGDGEAELELAALEGCEALRQLAFRRRGQWPGDLLARYLHLRGLAAMESGALAAAATAWRAALRAVHGHNLRLVGEIHLDLGSVAILLERMATAERHLQLAERLLESCGSRLAVTVARHNRAVLACDRLDWRTAEELILAGREVRGKVEDAAYWLEELELARCALVRGDLASVSGRLPSLAGAVARHLSGHLVARHALAGLGVHLALAEGDLQTATAAAEQADEDDQCAVRALAAAASGELAAPGAPERWGLALSARLVSAWKAGDVAEAQDRVAAELERSRLAAAVGVVRAVALASRSGIAPAKLPAELWSDIEKSLAAGGLGGWAKLLRRFLGVDAVAVVEALDGLVGAGTDALSAARLGAVAQALGLPWLGVLDGSEILASWGCLADEREEVREGQLAVVAPPSLHALDRATLRLLARHLAVQRASPEHVGELPGGGLLGVSQAMAGVREEISRWASLPVTVLILGEPGTGKELCARELHRQSGRRGSFVPVNCAGIPAALLESELFGVVRGAYTGADRDRLGLVEEAESGTLFLDEVGELPLELQGKLLRLLQEHEVRRVGATRTRKVDVRFVAATNRDLAAVSGAGGFRRDLFYRLTVGIIHMPPLRERPDDIDELARYFTHRFAASFNRPGVRLAPASLGALRGGDWPGNVRELESAIARAVAAARSGEVLGPDRFPDLAPAAHSDEPLLGSWDEAVEGNRRTYFTRLLASCGGNRSQAARQAGISRQTLHYHLRELGIR